MDETLTSESEPAIRPLDADGIEARVMLRQVRESMFGRTSPTRVGRFDLLEPLGRGAHGSVYLAEDRELQRHVAVKILNHSGSDPQERAKLLREAQTLARLKHPNVLAVHDVGLEDERVFIAMEYVEGGSLKDWCDEHPVGTRARFDELYELAIGAARGLEAAHEAGITHRDIKPANILVGADGRPRIADFGVARTTMLASGHALDTTQAVGSAAVVATHSHGVAGTPAYMAPEQFHGRGTAASDQWGLCATLWLATYGERPFGGESVGELISELERPPRAPPPQRSEVPRWWRDALLRGLRHDPGDRWPSVAALRAALEQGEARQRRRRVGLGLGAIAMGGIAAVVTHQALREQRRGRCFTEAARIEASWNDQTRPRLHDAFAASGVAYAEAAATHTAQYLDAYTDRWAELFSDLCVASNVTGSRTPDAWVASQRCLEDRRGHLDALLDVLLDDADPSTVEASVHAVARLPRSEPCGDDTWLSRNFTAPDDDLTADVIGKLRHVTALRSAGAYPRGLAIAKQLVETADGQADRRLKALVRHEAGRLSSNAGAPREARALLTEAFEDALAANEDLIALQVATDLIVVIGSGIADHESAVVWVRIANGLQDRLGNEDDLDAANLHESLGVLYGAQGKARESEQAHQRALSIRSTILGPEHPDVAVALNSLGAVYWEQGRFEEAESAYRRALEIDERALGPGHPRLAHAHGNLGALYREQGRLEQAEREHERALQIRQQAVGRDHVLVAKTIANLGTVYREQGRLDEAQRANRQSIEILQRTLGQRHPDVASALVRSGNLEMAQGELARAKASYEAALSIFEATLGADHPDIARTYANLGTIYAMQDDLAEAEKAWRKAIPIVEAALGPEHPHVAGLSNNLGALLQTQKRYGEAELALAHAVEIWSATLGPDNPALAEPLIGLAQVRMAVGRPSQAVDDAERALAILTASDAGSPQIATVKYELARALWASGEARARARTLTAEAVETLRTAGEEFADVRQDAEALQDLQTRR